MAIAIVQPPERRTAEAIHGDLQKISDRLAGVRKTLEILPNCGIDNFDDTLYLLADVVDRLNDDVVGCMNDVSKFSKEGVQ